MDVPSTWHDIHDRLLSHAGRMGLSGAVSALRGALADLRNAGVAVPSAVRESAQGLILEWHGDSRRAELILHKGRSADLCVWEDDGVVAIGSVSLGSVSSAYGRFLETEQRGDAALGRLP